MSQAQTIQTVSDAVATLYREATRPLPFHGWLHIEFVRAKALMFGHENGSDAELVELAALVHDLNYLVGPGTVAADGQALREKTLFSAGVPTERCRAIESIVLQAETRTRRVAPCREAQALSDADTLFKSLPITPVLLAPLFLLENQMSIVELSKKIVREQGPIAEQGYYFYSARATKQYGRWASANLELWRCVLDSLTDADVQEVVQRLSIAGVHPDDWPARQH